MLMTVSTVNTIIMKLIYKIGLLFLAAFIYSNFTSCQQLPDRVKVQPEPSPEFVEGELELAELVDSRSVTDRLKMITKLPVEVNECSGFELVDDGFWTLNDSGSPASIYKVSDKTDQLEHQISISSAENTDWEELASNDEYLFIGNFGNNYGMRKNLMVYAVSLEGVNKDSEAIELSSTLEFEFADQTEFRHTANKHNFDCEAMIASDDQLYLFSKNRGDNQCTIYSLDLKKSGEKQKAQPLSTFDTKGQVTAADYHEESGVLALLGYVYKPSDGSMHPFLYLFYDFPDNNFFKGKHKRIDLGIMDQTEGLSFVDASTLYIAAEAESGGQGNLYQFDISGLIE